MSALKIGLIGYGTIASDVLQELCVWEGRIVEWAALLRSDSTRRVPESIRTFHSLDALAEWQPDLVIEAASQAAVQEHVPQLLCAGFNVVVTSVGALADEPTRMAAMAAAEKGRAKVIVPAGAVASTDYLGALQGNASASVVYESRKPPAAWRDELMELGHDPDALTGELELFFGTAQEAALRYPKNLNVAATLALAGVGMEQTQVRVVVDPAVGGNQHRVMVRSPLGTLETTLVNNPAPGNPKTSWIVARSVAHAVRKQFSTLVVGG